MAFESYYSVLTAAVNDFIDHGFQSSEQLAFWVDKLRRAADSTIPGSGALEAELKRALIQTFQRAITPTGVGRSHKGVSQLTLDRIKPTLRLELERRIMAAAELIETNREEAINKTIKNFTGWATSIPKGGTSQAERISKKQAIRGSLARLPTEARRVASDQGFKLTAAIHHLIAINGGAIAAEWHSRWRQPGYDYREDHMERDGLVYLLRGSDAHNQGLVKPNQMGFADEISYPTEEPFCKCHYRYIYTLRNIPSDMLTAKGRAALMEGQQVFG